MTTAKVVHGDDLLYRFFQVALRDRPELFAAVPQMLVTAMAIWLPLDTYFRWPIVLPWVVRDARCRGNPGKGVPDEWSSPDCRGYLRDDNSLIKSLPRALAVRGPIGSHVHGARMGSEFVASHVWRTVRHEQLASRVPLLNSFVPNVVWLPSQVAKLTDREGGVVQQTLQAMAWQIYRGAAVAPHLAVVVEEAWELIPNPPIEVEPFGLDELNWFQATDGFYRTRSIRLRAVVDALESVNMGRPLPARVVTTRYAAGLPAVKEEARSDLERFLRRFLEP
jgi:hypothetical protein